MMATGGEVPGRSPGGAESEDFSNIKCQPCLEDGNLHEVVGMCIDFDEHLCETCFEHHRLPKPSRHHQLIDREQMMQSKIRASTEDACTERCPHHEDDVIKYYCLKHSTLGCTACITLDHKSCDGVQYIPRVAKDLSNNAEYMQAEIRLKATLDTLKTVSENVELNSEELESSCLKALNDIRDFRHKVNEAAIKIETELIKQLQEIKSIELSEIANIGTKYQATLKELKVSMKKIATLQNAKQLCSSYMEMMRIKAKLDALDSEIKEAEVDATYAKRDILFTPNQDILDTLKQADVFGVLSGSTTRSKVPNTLFGTLVRAAHAKDIKVKTGTDKSRFWITGITVLSGDRLLFSEYNSQNIKAISLQSGKVLTSLKLSSVPWDVTTTSSNTVAVTMPDMKKITMVTVGENTMNIDRSLNVNGSCFGIDYRNDKLAVSYSYNRVQVLSMQGVVLHDIAEPLNRPFYLTFGLDDDTLYVSNFSSNNVVHMKLDGTIVATYTDSKLQGPHQPVMDNNGEVLVCAFNSQTIHQITNDCKKVRVLLSASDDLSNPCAICLSEKKDKMYVGTQFNDNLKVYILERAAQSQCLLE